MSTPLSLFGQEVVLADMKKAKSNLFAPLQTEELVIKYEDLFVPLLKDKLYLFVSLGPERWVCRYEEEEGCHGQGRSGVLGRNWSNSSLAFGHEKRTLERKFTGLNKSSIRCI